MNSLAKMASLKIEKHPVLYKGRFIIRSDQINSNIAFRMLLACSNKKKSLIKTNLKIHENGFHIGSSNGLTNIKKIWYYYQDIKTFYIFRADPNAMIFVNKVKESFYMSFIRFPKLGILKTVTDGIEKTKGLSFVNSNPAFCDEIYSTNTYDSKLNEPRQNGLGEQLNNEIAGMNFEDLIEESDIHEGSMIDDSNNSCSLRKLSSTFDNLSLSEGDDMSSKIKPWSSAELGLYSDICFNDPDDTPVILHSHKHRGPVLNLNGVSESGDEEV